MQTPTVPAFLEHLADTRARLGLAAPGEGDADDHGACTLRTPRPGHAVPSSEWTPAEQNAFFRALAVYSRWRPDLIAAAVPTRTVWDVGQYLAALEEGAAYLQRMEDDDDGVDDGSETDVEIDWGDDGDDEGSDLDEPEPAYEVSEAWVAAEEALASCVVERDNVALFERHRGVSGGGSTDGETVQLQKKKRGRPPLDKSKDRRRYRRRGARRVTRDPGHGSDAGSPDSRKRAREDSVEDPPREDVVEPCPGVQTPNEGAAGSDVPRAKRPRVLVTREDYMARLEDVHLVVLDAILREDEEASRVAKSREGSQDAGGLPPETREERFSESESGTDTLASPTPVDDPNVVIDPALLAISEVRNGATTTVVSSMPVPSQVPVPADHSFPGTSAQPILRSDPAPSEAGPTSEEPTGLNPDVFSPKARRRLQKRLYMRRRRAKVQGTTTDMGGKETLDAELPTELGRLKPGRKGKAVSQGTTPVSDVETDNDDHQQQPAKRKRSKGGLTLPYKLRAAFQELGIDAAYLRAEGMDLLHLSALANLRGLYDAYERDGSGVQDDLPDAIDASVIRHLQAAVVLFVTEVMHRAIVWREREVRLKKSLAWRTGEQITPNAVEHALDMLGVRHQSHKQYFAELWSRYSAERPRGPAEFEFAFETETEAEADASTTSEAKEGQAREGEEEEDPAVPALSTHRDIYLPLIRPPAALGVHPLDCFSRTYMREGTRRADRRAEGERRGDEDEEGDLMPGETDEEALAAELEEDEALDEEDMESTEEYEEGLWEALWDMQDDDGVRR